MENQNETLAAQTPPSTEASVQSVLSASSAEENELKKLIAAGHSAYGRIAFMTFVGIILLFAGLMYWDKLDYYPVEENSSWEPFAREYLPALVENENSRQASAYVLKPNVSAPPAAPQWPEILYNKLRFDIYVIAGLVFILSLIHMRIESAKNQRNDLLLFRTMAREIEKLRQRMTELEKNADIVKEDNSSSDN